MRKTCVFFSFLFIHKKRLFYIIRKAAAFQSVDKLVPRYIQLRTHLIHYTISIFFLNSWILKLIFSNRKCFIQRAVMWAISTVSIQKKHPRFIKLTLFIHFYSCMNFYSRLSQFSSSHKNESNELSSRNSRNVEFIKLAIKFPVGYRMNWIRVKKKWRLIVGAKAIRSFFTKYGTTKSQYFSPPSFMNCWKFISVYICMRILCQKNVPFAICLMFPDAIRLIE